MWLLDLINNLTGVQIVVSLQNKIHYMNFDFCLCDQIFKNKGQNQSNLEIHDFIFN